MTFKFEGLNNGTDMEFSDISSEKYRTYKFPSDVVHIEEPIALHVSKSGGHRVLDADGTSHYIPAGWIHLYWKAKEGSPHFVK
jgi:hypothetical protein